MKKKLLFTLLLTIVMTMCFGMTAFASPKTMPDGTVFDAEYYAKTYPDVVSAIGTDENALYQHYVMAGKAEGRHPVAPVQTTESKPSANSSNLDNTLASIQNKLDTGTIEPCLGNGNLRVVNKFIADENIDDYIEPILNVMARNGYKYIVHPVNHGVDNTGIPFNGTCNVQSSEFLEKRYIYVANTNHVTENKDEREIIEISICKSLKDYSVSIMGVTNSTKKNDISVCMQYDAPYDEEWNAFVREIPVN